MNNNFAPGTKYYPTMEGIFSACEVCASISNLQRCSRCKITLYCSREHQKFDYKRHKSECKKFAEMQGRRAAGASPLGGSHSRASSTSGMLYDALFEKPSNGANIDNTFDSLVDFNPEEVLESINGYSDEASSLEMPISALKILDSVEKNNINSASIKPDNVGKSQGLVGQRRYKEFPSVSLPSAPCALHPMPLNFGRGETLDDISKCIIHDMNHFGMCVIDDLLGKEMGLKILQEVRDMYQMGVFRDGQLVSNKRPTDTKSVRGDKITWIEGKEQGCTHIGHLIHTVDTLVLRTNKSQDNGKLGCYNINGRTKAMVACYPGFGTHYVRHVDNPNRDGRCITAIYYLNQDWHPESCGGMLRIFPMGGEVTADIEPHLDRIIFFWSDRRNPHEVQPAFMTRYAITLWYFDAAEREEARLRYLSQEKRDSPPTLQTPPPMSQTPR